MRVLKLIIIFLTLSFLSSCKLFTGSSLSHLAFTNFKVPDGTPIFQKGYSDGCQNGLFSRGNMLYRTRYGIGGFKYDADYIDNPEYRFGVSRGYSYCFTYNTAGRMVRPMDEYLYGKGTQFNMGRNSYNKSLQYESGSWSNAANVKHGGVNGIFSAVTKPKGFTAMGSHPLFGTPNSNQLFGW
jgi:hypothetical protein